MKALKILSFCFTVALLIVACKKKDENLNNQLNDADKNFISLASVANYSEAETAKLALSKTTDTIVLSFAQQMFTQYANAEDDLKIMGKIVGFAVTDTTNAANAATIAHLDSMTGRAFDSAYIHTRLATRDTTVSFYTNELKNGRQLNVRAYANSNLQIIQADYARADSIAAAFY